MAESDVILNPGSGGAAVRTWAVQENGKQVQQQVVTLADAEANLLDGSGRVQGAATAPSSGTGGGTVPSAATGRVMTLRAFAVGSDGTVTFTGGTLNGLVVTVRSGSGFDWTPATEQTCLTEIVFGPSLDYFVEWA